MPQVNRQQSGLCIFQGLDSKMVGKPGTSTRLKGLDAGTNKECQGCLAICFIEPFPRE